MGTFSVPPPRCHLVGLCRHWNAAFRHEHPHPHLWRLRVPLPRQPRRAALLNPLLLCADGRASGIRFGKVLQACQGAQPFQDDLAHRHSLPRRVLCHVLHPQHGCLGEAVFDGGALRHPRCPDAPLVRSLPPPHLFRCLPGLQEGGHRGPVHHKPHPASDSPLSVVPPHRMHHACRWASAVWVRVCRDALHPLIHLAASLLLHVRFPLHGLPHPSRHMC
mmetsp:Transcript_28288/g.67992  ORF Transcript_28288/g.67992 Transcript_28288/m.67992 type:complete len:219 (+) Transcript_28288:1054-1710(+)